MDKWGIQLSAWVENIVGKEEIVCTEQFLLFPQCFQKQSVVDVLKLGIAKSNWLTGYLFERPNIGYRFQYSITR